MKANELRIGNYVKDPYNKTIKLVSIEKDASMLRPISLTEEWLLKFGFNKNILTTSIRFWITDFNIREFNKSKKIQVSYRNSIYNHIEYVHQLQNLYFALTGEELKSN